MNEPAEQTDAITRRQRSILYTVGAIVTLIVTLQSYGILPYQMGDVRARLTVIEQEARVARDSIVKLDAQLIAARDEMRLLRADIAILRSEMREAVRMGGIR